MPIFILSARGISKGEFVPEPGRPHYLEIPDGQPISADEKFRHKSQDWLDRVQSVADGRAGRRSGEAGDVLVLVHGYNNTLDEIRIRHETLQVDLSAEGWRGLVVSFDWPTGKSPLNNLEDRSDAAETAHYLVSGGIGLLIKGQTRGCQTNIHLLGHSTGAFVIMDAFVAADVSASSLNADSQWAEPMFRRIMRLTNYQNGFDDVLGVSSAKRLGASPRAGRVGLSDSAHSKAVNVDCSGYFNALDPELQTSKVGWWNHSWHFGNRVFARDLAMTLEGRIDRNYLPTREKRGDNLVLCDAPRPVHEVKWLAMNRN